MKKIAFLSIFFIGYLHFYGQNIMFYPLHYSYEYDYVIHYLNNLPADEVKVLESGIVFARYDGFSANYYFNEKQELYKVETIKAYDHHGRMNKALRKAYTFLESLHITMYETRNAGGEKKWMGRTKLPVGEKKKKEYEFDLVLHKYASNDMEVSLGGICLQRKPANEPTYIPTRKDGKPIDLNVSAKKTLKDELMPDDEKE